MTVKELIDKLKKYPEDMDIVVFSEGSHSFEYASHIEETKNKAVWNYDFDNVEARTNKQKRNVITIS